MRVNLFCRFQQLPGLLFLISFIAANAYSQDAASEAVVDELSACMLEFGWSDKGYIDSIFKSEVKKFPSIQSVDGNLYVFETDILLTESEAVEFLWDFRCSDIGKGVIKHLDPELLIAVHDGNFSVWPKKIKSIGYEIRTSDFSPAENSVLQVAMDEATKDWNSACQKCDIHFVQAKSKDDSTITFEVVKENTDAFEAAAFFPHSPENRRFLRISPNFFKKNREKAGIIRHEFGHILGYKHEHYRVKGNSGSLPFHSKICRYTNSEWVPVTNYDPFSVMHYLCYPGGTRSLKISDVDKKGHTLTYGAGE